MNPSPSILKHVRDIIILPFSVTVLIPYYIQDPRKQFIPDMPALKIAGVLLMAAGLGLFLYTVFLFKTKAQGTLAPWQPTKKLIVIGPYRYCRNPMITGVLAVLLGESLFFHSQSALEWAGLFFVINSIYFVILEEPSMLARFGDAYRQYKNDVPRWIPRIPKKENWSP